MWTTFSGSSAGLCTFPPSRFSRSLSQPVPAPPGGKDRQKWCSRVLRSLGWKGDCLQGCTASRWLLPSFPKTLHLGANPSPRCAAVAVTARSISAFPSPRTVAAAPAPAVPGTSVPLPMELLPPLPGLWCYFPTPSFNTPVSIPHPRSPAGAWAPRAGCPQPGTAVPSRSGAPAAPTPSPIGGTGL